MAKTNAMGLTDITALTSRIQELERENSRLRAILDKNGISYTFKDNNLQENAVPAPVVTYSLEEKVAIFQGLFQGRSDVFANDGIVKQVKSRAISLCAKGSGIASFATNGNINAPIAQTASSHHCLTSICSITLQEKTSGGVM